MTGFEEWVKVGLELFAAEVLKAAEGLDLGKPDTPRIVARRLMQSWPPWKREATRSRDVAPGNRCPKCGKKTHRLVGTAEGPLCPSCADKVIFPEG
jgi:hypothetical protein